MVSFLPYSYYEDVISISFIKCNPMWKWYVPGKKLAECTKDPYEWALLLTI